MGEQVVHEHETSKRCFKSSLIHTAANLFCEKYLTLPALSNGEIIEQYPADYPFPSCLALGFNKAGHPIHIVCGSDEKELWIVTAYYPSPVEWTEDFKQRRRNS